MKKKYKVFRKKNLTMLISLLALCLSGTVFYFQFFYKNYSVEFNTFSVFLENDSLVTQTIFRNNGNEQATILGIEFQINTTYSSNYLLNLEANKFNNAIILNPKEMKIMKYKVPYVDYIKNLNLIDSIIDAKIHYITSNGDWKAIKYPVGEYIHTVDQPTDSTPYIETYYIKPYYNRLFIELPMN